MDELRNRVEIFNNGTIEDLIAFCFTRGVKPSEVTITTCHVRYKSYESPEERAARLQWEADQAARKEKWERSTYQRLKEKYGDAPASG